MLAVATLALSEIFLSKPAVGHAFSMAATMEASSKMTAVASRPKPRRTTYLLVGLDLKPPKFAMV